MYRLEINPLNLDEVQGLNHLIDEPTTDEGNSELLPSPVKEVEEFEKEFYHSLHRIPLDYPIPYEVTNVTAPTGYNMAFNPPAPVYSFSEWSDVEGDVILFGVFTRQGNFYF